MDIDTTSARPRAALSQIGRGGGPYGGPGCYGNALLLVGMFLPWVSTSYLGDDRLVRSVVHLPGGPLYMVVVLVLVASRLSGRPGGAVGRSAAVVTAAYAALWLVGEIMLASSPGGTLADLGSDTGLFASAAGAVLALGAAWSDRRDGPGSSPADEPGLVLGRREGDPTSEFSSREAFIDRLAGLCGVTTPSAVPLIFVRLRGLDRVSRSATPAAERLVAVLTHRLRSSVRATDVAAAFSPGEMFIVLADSASEANVASVAGRIRIALQAPVNGVGPAISALLRASVETAWAEVVDGHLRIRTADETLVDAPITVETACRRQGLTASTELTL